MDTAPPGLAEIPYRFVEPVGPDTHHQHGRLDVDALATQALFEQKCSRHERPIRLTRLLVPAAELGRKRQIVERGRSFERSLGAGLSAFEALPSFLVTPEHDQRLAREHTRCCTADLSAPCLPRAQLRVRPPVFAAAGNSHGPARRNRRRAPACGLAARAPLVAGSRPPHAFGRPRARSRRGGERVQEGAARLGDEASWPSTTSAKRPFVISGFRGAADERIVQHDGFPAPADADQ